MTDEHPKPENESDSQLGPTRRLEKAIDDMASGDYAEGTLMSIEAHTGEYQSPPEPEPSVTDALRNVRKPSSNGPDVAPAATMYEPTKPGQVSAGSAGVTAYGPTGTGTPHSGSVSASSTPRPVAPFGGKIVVGTRFGQIEVTGVLGKGGMGEVFKGYHHALDINVAIKVLPDELSRNELVRQRFLREARLCVKLDHPHVVRVYNVDEYAGNLYLVMEMIEGTDAAHMLKNGGRFRYKRALEIGAASAEALSYAHSQGLVHRDVKPHNILLGASDGKIKISDFGLARAATSSSHLTMSGQIMGTPHYMSPEQAESKEVSDKSDVYSLGVTLYHMLTGETPFVGDTPISVAVQHIAKEIIYPEMRFKPFPKELVAVLKRMTAKDAAKRCNAKQAAVWLRKLIAMAPQDDIQIDDENAMKSMAPVVRESQAFEQAANERRQRDEHARELARTMLATMQEDSARRPAVQQTQQQAQPVSVVQQPQKQGMSLAAVLLVLVLLGGGGAAGWYFTVGPGAGTFGGGNQPIAGTDAGKSGDTGAGGTGGQNTGGTPLPGDTGGNTTGGTPLPGDTGGNTTGGNTTGGEPLPGDTGGNTGGEPLPGDTGGNTTGGELPPPDPAAKDDPAIESYLSGGHEAIAAAKSPAELREVGANLGLARQLFNRGRGSERQRARFNELESDYDNKFAFLSTYASIQRMRDSLTSYEAERETNLTRAIVHLNTAIRERDSLGLLKVPADTEALVRDDRNAIIERVTTTRAALWSELDTEAKRHESAESYDAARQVLDTLLAITSTPEVSAEVSKRRDTAWLLDHHKAINKALEGGLWPQAAKRLKDTQTATIPDHLTNAQAAIVKKVADSFDAEHKLRCERALAAAATGSFGDARTEYGLAVAIPDQTTSQTGRLSEVILVIDVKESLHHAGAAIDANDFHEAKARLEAADERIKRVTEGEVPGTVTRPRDDMRNRYDTALEAHFAKLLKDAESLLSEREFTQAGTRVSDAANLPLTPAQRDRLVAFRDANEKALEDYVRGLIEDVEDALNDNDFDRALKALSDSDSLTPPDDLKPKLIELRQRFGEEAARRHDELLATARADLSRKAYAEVRAGLKSAAAIPVDGERQAARKALDEECTLRLVSDFDDLVREAEALLETQDYHGARKSLDAAQKVALTDELDRRLRQERDEWEAEVEARLAELLQSSASSIDRKLFNTSESALTDAEALPLEGDQITRVSKARDAHRAAMTAERARLVTELQKCIDRGDEAEGEKILERIYKLNPPATEQPNLNRMRQALRGETDADRFKRLPRHLHTQWDDRYCKAEQLFDVGEEVTALAVTNDGRFACAGTASGKVQFFNLRRGSTYANSIGGTRKITAVAINADGTLGASVDDRGNVVLFELSGSTVKATPLESLPDTGVSADFSPTANLLVFVTDRGFVQTYNPANKARLTGERSGLSRAYCGAISPDGGYLAIGGNSGEVALMSLPGLIAVGSRVKVPGNDNVQRVAFSPDSKLVVAGSIGNGVAHWAVSNFNGKPAQEYKKLSEWVRGVGFSSDGRRVVAFDSEKRLTVFDVASGREVGNAEFDSRLKGSKRFLATAGVVAPDGTVLIGTREGEIVHLTVQTVR